MTKIKQVALAICRATHTGGQCIEPGNCDLCQSGSWAAVAAMREPTEAMLEEITESWTASIIWEMMIDEALKERDG